MVIADSIPSTYIRIENTPSFAVVKDTKDLSALMEPGELFRERKKNILRNIDCVKLNNSLLKAVKNKNWSYSHKELTHIMVSLGYNANPLKSILVEQLKKIKKEFDAEEEERQQ